MGIFGRRRSSNSSAHAGAQIDFADEVLSLEEVHSLQSMTLDSHISPNYSSQYMIHGRPSMSSKSSTISVNKYTTTTASSKSGNHSRRHSSALYSSESNNGRKTLLVPCDDLIDSADLGAAPRYRLPTPSDCGYFRPVTPESPNGRQRHNGTTTNNTTATLNTTLSATSSKTSDNLSDCNAGNNSHNNSITVTAATEKASYFLTETQSSSSDSATGSHMSIADFSAEQVVAEPVVSKPEADTTGESEEAKTDNIYPVTSDTASANGSLLRRARDKIKNSVLLGGLKNTSSSPDKDLSTSEGKDSADDNITKNNKKLKRSSSKKLNDGKRENSNGTTVRSKNPIKTPARSQTLPVLDTRSGLQAKLGNDASQICSPASMIFERNVQDQIFTPGASSTSNLSNSIPMHFGSEDQIPPVLDASIEVMVDETLDPNSIEVVSSHKNGLGPYSDAQSTGGINISPSASESKFAIYASKPDLSGNASPVTRPCSSGGDGLSDCSRRLSFFSFADVVNNEQLKTANASGSIISSPPKSTGSGFSSPSRKNTMDASQELRSDSGTGMPRISSYELPTVESNLSGANLRGGSQFYSDPTTPPSDHDVEVTTMSEVLRRNTGEIASAMGPSPIVVEGDGKLMH